MNLPLQGIRVIDVSENLAGPYCTQILADMGADVLKVERPGGDPARAWGPPFVGGDSALFVAANRNKAGVELDLRTAAGSAALRAHLKDADVFVQSFRPGVIERLGFGEEAVRAIAPDIIHVSISAFGTHGPLRDSAGYEPLMQAFAGILSVTGEADGPPVRVGTSIVDMGTGMWAALAVVAALRERDRTGKGRRIDASLFGTALAWMGYHIPGCMASGVTPGRHGTAFPSIAPYDAFETADGRLMIAAGNDALFDTLCAVLSLEEISGDDRYATNALRVAHRGDLDGAIAAAVSNWTTIELEAALHEAGVPCAPIQDVAELLRHPQTRASGLLSALPGTPTVPVVALPVRWDDEVFPVRRAPPARAQ
jgi:crotonobetainyl-CoA:carnitine CoA-transferase CaiB-like acyl-CoA transferase